MEILVKPMDMRLPAAAGMNLLDTLREHHIPISYSCMAGRCGTCRCTVLEGDVRGLAAAEGRPTPRGNTVLACQTQLHGDCVIEVPEPDEVVVHPARKLKGEVVAFEPLTHEVRRLLVRTNRPLEFSPGQYAHLQFDSGRVRPYSMVGLPEDALLEFHIRIVPDGRLTPWLDHNLSVGDRLRISGPLGASYLRRKHQGPMLCVAGGTGFGPMYSVARGALTSGMSNPIQFVFGVRAERDVFGVQELEALARGHANFSYQVTLSETTTGQCGYQSGLVTDVLRRGSGPVSGWRVYIAGPPAMVEAVDALVSNGGVERDHVHADAFYPAGI